MARRPNKPPHPSAAEGTEGSSEAVSERRDPVEFRPEPPSAEQAADDLSRTANQLLDIVGSPIFAYALAAILAVPAMLWLTEPAAPTPDVTPPAEVSDVATSKVRLAEIPEEPVSPRARALRMLDGYQQALRDRDINALRRYWDMTPQEQSAMEELFRDARIVSPLVDLQQVEGESDERMRIAFAQVLTLVRGAGQFYARGPTVFRAEAVRAPGFDSWMMRNREEVPQQGNAKPVASE